MRMPLFAVLLGFVTPSPVADLALQIRSTVNSISVGQPLQIQVRWSASVSTPIAPGALEILIDSGQGFEDYDAPTDRSSGNSILVPETLPSGAVRTTTVIISLTRKATGYALALPLPQTYRFMVRQWGVESNVLSISATQPSGEESEVLGVLRARPQLLSPEVVVDPALRQAAEDLLSAHQGSVYLQHLKLLLWGSRLRADIQVDDQAGRPPLDGQTGESLNEIEGQSTSPFDAQRLALVAMMRVQLGDILGARRVYGDIARRFPDSESGDEARRWLVGVSADTTPPTVLVASAPSSIWPPNKDMFPIATTVTATDDSGLPPTVRLLSITCNDECNTSNDIADAAFGTDDRAFKLRADRTGGRNGRTYTISYEASDAAGNKTTGTTTVIVPHDQGKK